MQEIYGSTTLRRSRDKIVSPKRLAQLPDLCYNNQCTLVHNPTRWRSTQVAEGDGLLNPLVWGDLQREFESPLLRQDC